MSNDLTIIKITNIFHNVHYVVPIYQRNYAWNETQITQLIEDVNSLGARGHQEYFLGNLIVNQTDNNVFEVVDGQQRLTTLYLLEKYLDFSFPKDALRFEARENSNRTLAYINEGKNFGLLEELSSLEILRGYEIIENHFKSQGICVQDFKNKLNRVSLLRVQVPKNIDLNHYFEIMNTRGEQLELHEIVKAKLLDVLNSKQERKVAAMIWDKCSEMNSYVQMNFDVDSRKNLFTDNWTSLQSSIQAFDDIMSIFKSEEKDEEKLTLIEIIKGRKFQEDSKKSKDDENERFESTMTFSNFLLQVNAAISNVPEDSSLDDRKFLNNLSWTWSSTEQAKHYLFHLLKCRVLFDKYILKREFARDYKDSGKWSLQRLEKYIDPKKDNAKPKYVGTLGDESKENKQLRMLQSCLRITYSSPSNMHWITQVLSKLLENENTDLIRLLESFAQQKVSSSNYESKKGFEFERIVFTYLDYLLYRDGYSYNNEEIIQPLSDEWQFQFRSSIEHFYPQNPVEAISWLPDDLNGFGNLALITASGNSKFSNIQPAGKIATYGSIISQSLKLTIMAKMTKDNINGWTQELSTKHQDEMFKILGRASSQL